MKVALATTMIIVIFEQVLAPSPPKVYVGGQDGSPRESRPMNETLESTEVPTVSEPDEQASTALRLADRCDKRACNAQAIFRYAKAFVPEGATEEKVQSLDFCLHHERDERGALESDGFVPVEDVSDTINQKPSSSAAAGSE